MSSCSLLLCYPHEMLEGPTLGYRSRGTGKGSTVSFHKLDVPSWNLKERGLPRVLESACLAPDNVGVGGGLYFLQLGTAWTGMFFYLAQNIKCETSCTSLQNTETVCRN